MFAREDILSELDRGAISVGRSNPDSRYRRRLLPSIEAAVELQYAYTYFNEALFGGALPPCILTYVRRRRCLGYFAPDRFERTDGERVGEVALNPTHLAARDDRDSLSTLVHEQVHVWRHYLAPPRRAGVRRTTGYHDRVWADRMERAGLMPSDTGRPGGKRTGNRMTHYIIAGGAFDRACATLLATGFRINWHDHLQRKGSSGGPAGEPGAEKADRIKFSCLSCHLNAWAKPTAHLTCTDCRLPMSASGQAPSSAIPLVPAIRR